MRKTWKDCYFELNQSKLIVGNSTLQTIWKIHEHGLQLQVIENTKNHISWGEISAEISEKGMQVLPNVSWHVEEADSFLEEAHWLIRCSMDSPSPKEIYIKLFPDSPFISFWDRMIWQKDKNVEESTGAESPSGIESDGLGQSDSSVNKNTLFQFKNNRRHLEYEDIRLVDKTDIHDTLVQKLTGIVYPRENLSIMGNFFHLMDYREEESLIFVQHSPLQDNLYAKFYMSQHVVNVKRNEYRLSSDGQYVFSSPCVVGLTKTPEIWLKYRKLYRQSWRAPWQKHSYLTSNTWGDRSRDARVSEAFVKKEIDQAVILGIDVVQIDDGWQNGRTSNSATPEGGVWEGYHDLNPEFWMPHPERFPNGLVPVAEYAKSKNIHLALWFSPDSSNDFAHWKKDADILLQFWRELGIGIFKLDGVKLKTIQGRTNYLEFLECLLNESQGQIVLQQDITAEERLAYLANMELSTLFVENRYTDFGNYYPHRTLRNLWQLSEMIPSQRMLFELLNTTRNLQNYEGDPLAPNTYSAEYILATLLPTQVLFWMELSNYPMEKIRELQPLLTKYKEHREAMWNMDCHGIGNTPDGYKITGFSLVNDDMSAGYILIYRENSEDSRIVIPEFHGETEYSIVYSNCEVKEVSCDQGIEVELSEPKSFVWYKWES